MDGFPSGQRGQTVNLLHIASVVRIHLHPCNQFPSEIGYGKRIAAHERNATHLCHEQAINFLRKLVTYAGVAELADAQDLKSCGTNLPYRFDSGRRHVYLSRF